MIDKNTLTITVEELDLSTQLLEINCETPSIEFPLFVKAFDLPEVHHGDKLDNVDLWLYAQSVAVFDIPEDYNAAGHKTATESVIVSGSFEHNNSVIMTGIVAEVVDLGIDGIKWGVELMCCGNVFDVIIEDAMPDCPEIKVGQVMRVRASAELYGLEPWKQLPELPPKAIRLKIAKLYNDNIEIMNALANR